MSSFPTHTYYCLAQLQIGSVPQSDRSCGIWFLLPRWVADFDKMPCEIGKKFPAEVSEPWCLLGSPLRRNLSAIWDQAGNSGMGMGIRWHAGRSSTWGATLYWSFGTVSKLLHAVRVQWRIWRYLANQSNIPVCRPSKIFVPPPLVNVFLASICDLACSFQSELAGQISAQKTHFSFRAFPFRSAFQRCPTVALRAEQPD